MSAPRPHRLRNLTINKVALVDAGAGKGVKIQLWKRRAGTEKSMTFEELMASLSEEQRAVITAHMEQLAGKSKDSAPDSKEEAMKRLSPELRAELEKRDSEIAKLRKDAEERDRKDREREYITKARALKGLPADEKTLGKLLDVIDAKLDAADAKAARDMLSKASAVIEKSAAFQELGSRTDDGVTGPWQQLEGIAKGLREKDPKLSKQAAIAKACSDHPELYREYVNAGAGA